jgi:hypothetical protein
LLLRLQGLRSAHRRAVIAADSPYGVRGVSGGELFPGGAARDVLDLDCGEPGGAMRVYGRTIGRTE